mmetsp:Transcript_3135/g.7245  ORF Transcript_3135/g.7245 Transcript_3135/m.7245 type:complete len:309 (-) Transcript_3135:1722-2648(-)
MLRSRSVVAKLKSSEMSRRASLKTWRSISFSDSWSSIGMGLTVPRVSFHARGALKSTEKWARAALSWSTPAASSPKTVDRKPRTSLAADKLWTLFPTDKASPVEKLAGSLFRLPREDDASSASPPEKRGHPSPPLDAFIDAPPAVPAGVPAVVAEVAASAQSWAEVVASPEAGTCLVLALEASHRETNSLRFLSSICCMMPRESLSMLLWSRDATWREQGCGRSGDEFRRSPLRISRPPSFPSLLWLRPSRRRLVLVARSRLSLISISRPCNPSDRRLLNSRPISSSPPGRLRHTSIGAHPPFQRSDA